MTSPKLIPLILANESPPKPSIPIPKPKKKIKVGLVNINNIFSGQNSEQTYFPYSVGCLQAYAQKFAAHPESYEFMLPEFLEPENYNDIEEAAERLSEADIVSYSDYGWNNPYCLVIAKEVKKRNPNVINVFGGPQIPDSTKQFQRIKKSDPGPENLTRGRAKWTEDFHREHPYIDVCCHGEGERVFTAILNQFAIDSCANKSSLLSVSYVDRNGNFHHNPKLERMHDRELEQAPSPYLEGVFDRLFDLYPELIFIGMLETNRGCPYQCSYCEWGGAIEDKVFKFNMERLRKEALWFGERKIGTIFCADANWGILKRDVEIAEYYAEAKRKYGFPKGLSTQNAKNPKEHTIDALLALERAGLNRATVMSQQSTNPETLRLVRRENMDFSEYAKIQKRLAEEGVPILTDIIFPMPAETYDTVADGVEKLATHNQLCKIQFGIISSWPNSELSEPEYVELHGIELVETDLVNIHGKRKAVENFIRITQKLAVATKSMPRPDWIRTRVFTWMTDTVFFNKPLQIPAVILHRYRITYREFIELFCGGFERFGNFPVLSEINNLLTDTAKAIGEGRQAEFIHSKEWLDIYWPPGEYILIKLCVEDKLDSFYQEAEMALNALLAEKGIIVPENLVHQAIKLNRVLIKEPFQTSDLEIQLSYNVWDAYRQTLLGNQIELTPGNYTYTIDRTSETWNSWEEWCEKVVWYGNRRGAYLYGNKNPHEEIAGHH